MNKKKYSFLAVSLLFLSLTLMKSIGPSAAYAADSNNGNSSIGKSAFESDDGEGDARKKQLKKTLETLENVRKAEMASAAANVKVSKPVPAIAGDKKSQQVPVNR